MDPFENLFKNLANDVKDYWAPLSRINRIKKPDPFTFYKEYVSKRIPVIIIDAIDHWPALIKWKQREYLLNQLKDTNITVDITPNGYGDAIHNHLFIKPEERKMKFSSFINALNNTNFDGIPYVSYQNDSLRDEFHQIMKDVDDYIDFAYEAFGNKPEAINLWMGDDRSVSSLHKDHYENMYCVVKGRKYFTLLPPSDIAFLYESNYISGTFVHNDNVVPNEEYIHFNHYHSWKVKYDKTIDNKKVMIPWIPIDPEKLDQYYDTYPMTKYIRKIECTVNPGEMLYLPAMWYHKVKQTSDTIAVNYWHDMVFDSRYVYYSFVKEVAKFHNKKEDPLKEDNDESYI